MSHDIPLTPKLIEAKLSEPLGSGLWGAVLDVGDGTVLKLARRFCEGIGDGLEKIQREHVVLRALAPLSVKTVSLPRSLGWGERQPSNVDDDRVLWLHATKVLGRTYKVAQLQTLPVGEVEQIATSLAKNLFELHSLFRQAKLNSAIPGAVENLQMVADAKNVDLKGRADTLRLQKVLISLKPENAVAIHGDFNISNVLFKGNSVSSVLDFAEARNGFPEEDLAAIISELPNFRVPLIKAYETQSGKAVNEKLLQFGLASRELLTAIICKNLGENKHSLKAQANLDQLFEKLEA